MNCGGPAVNDSGGAWAADNSWINGAASQDSLSIALAGSSSPMYYSRRFYSSAPLAPSPGRPGYNISIPLSVTSAVVRMHFANFFLATSTVGTRVFNIFINDMNTPAVANFDIIAAAGGDRTGGWLPAGAPLF
jgi:hypothetical protein